MKVGTTAVWCANAGTTAMPGTTPVSQRAPILSNVERHGSDAVRVVCIYVQRRRGPAGQLGMMKDDMTGKRLRRGNVFLAIQTDHVLLRASDLAARKYSSLLLVSN